MDLRSKIKNIYFDNSELTKKDYYMGRKYFIFEGSAAVGIFSLSSGAFLAGLANYMGATDEVNGIIGAIPALAGVFQIFSAQFFERIEQRKFYISSLCFLYRTMLGIMFLIPYFILNKNISITVLAIFYGIAYLVGGFISPPISKWVVDLTPNNIRGKYFAIKDAVSLAFMMVLTILIGKIMDYFRTINNQRAGFLINSVVIIVLAGLNFYFLSRIREPHLNVKNSNINIKDTILKPLKDKKFVKIIQLFILWNVGVQMAGPFFSVYMVTNLKLPYIYIMIMGIIGSVARIITLPIWGKIGDNKSWPRCAMYSIGMLAITHFIWFFINTKTAWILVPLVNFIGGIAWGGINMSLFNIQFVFAPEEGKTMYLGTNAAIGGLFGFSSTIIGSMLLKKLNIGFIFGKALNVSNMQIIFLISSILLTACAFFAYSFSNIKKIVLNN